MGAELHLHLVSTNDACFPLPGAAHKLVCYFTNWAFSRPSPASILPRDLDPFLCTHLVFAFASMNNSQIVPKDTLDEKILYPEFNKLKERCVHCVCGGCILQVKRSKSSLLLVVTFPLILCPSSCQGLSVVSLLWELPADQHSELILASLPLWLLCSCLEYGSSLFSALHPQLTLQAQCAGF